MSEVPKAGWSRRLVLVRELLQTVSRSTRWGLVASYAVSTLCSAFLPLSLKLLVDGITTDDANLAMIGVALGALTAAGSDGAGRASKDLMLYFRAAGGHALNVKAMRSMAKLPSLEHLERPDHLDHVRLISGEGRTVAGTIPEALSAARTLIQVGVSLVLLISVDVRLVAFPIFVAPGIYLIPRISRLRRNAASAAAESERRSIHLNDLFTDVDAAMEMRVFGASAMLDAEADRLWNEAIRTRSKAELRAARLAGVGHAILALGYVGALAVVGIDATRDATAAGDMIMVIQLATRLRWQLQGSMGLAQQMRDAVETIDRAIWVEDYRPSGYDRQSEQPPPARLERGIEIRDLTFVYPGTEQPVLRGIDLSLPAGSTVALVGDNGAGKTTLVKLLCAFYRPTKGRITVDGIDLSDVDPGQWQMRVAAAFQDYLRLEDRFRYSIGPPARSLSNDDESIIEAARRGDAFGLMESWPEGLDTHIGKSYHPGVQLSGGQWQRVAVARAMLPRDPLLLILDEPTAALDPAAEHRLYERYNEAVRSRRENQGCLTLLISHRFSTVRLADLIVVLENGAVTEVGSHAQLMGRGGTYATLYTRQAKAYA